MTLFFALLHFFAILPFATLCRPVISTGTSDYKQICPKTYRRFLSFSRSCHTCTMKTKNSMIISNVSCDAPAQKGRRLLTGFWASPRKSAMRLRTLIHPSLPGNRVRANQTQSGLIRASQGKKMFLKEVATDQSRLVGTPQPAKRASLVLFHFCGVRTARRAVPTRRHQSMTFRPILRLIGWKNGL